MIKSIEDQLVRDEGVVLHAYRDHLGYLTIGIGRLIDSRKGGGITKEEAVMLLKNDISKRDKELRKKIPWYSEMDEIRRAVLLNMSFQMGVEGLLKFKNTLELVRTKQYKQAASGMLKSLWARQTPERAKRLSVQMETGKWQ